MSSSTTSETMTAWLLGKILPNRIKRLIFISSFIAHIKNTTNPDKTLLLKINKLFSLSRDDEAMLLPFRLQDRIWESIALKEILQEKSIVVDDVSQIAEYRFVKPQIRTLSEDIIKIIPRWLKYGSNNQIRSDLITMFKNTDALFQRGA